MIEAEVEVGQHNFECDRRALLTSLAALGVLACGGGSRSFLFDINGFRCTAPLPRGTRVYPVRVRRFRRLDLHEQEGAELCWAAAIQAVLAHHRKSITQAEIVEKVRGASGGGFGAATLREIIRGISGRRTSWHVNNGNGAALVQDLRNGNPVLIGVRSEDSAQGHIVVAYEAAYVVNYMTNQTFVDRVRVWDPWIGEGHKWLSGCRLEEDIQFALHAWAPD